MSSIKEQIIQKARDLNIDKIGFAEIAELNDAKVISQQLYEQERFANCNYLFNNLSYRANPKLLMPAAKSAIAFAVNYFTDLHHSPEAKGKISRHAWGRDYHGILREKANAMKEFIKEKFDEDSFISIDGGKVFEKLWAERCGIGWQGKNSLLITREYGSWVFLGVIFTSLEIEPEDPHPNLCGSCNKCRSSCPNNAIIADKIVDIRKCIAFLTIEDRKNEYWQADSKSAGYLYGCDLCQDVCPFNQKILHSNHSDFQAVNSESFIEPEAVLQFTKDDFDNRFRDSSIKRIGVKKLQANATNIIKE